MFRKVVEGSLTDKTDAQLLSLLLNNKDENAMKNKGAPKDENIKKIILSDFKNANIPLEDLN